ncbi:histone deacetylase HDT1-like [Alnus glutinosa]|uniref:histone deacetylase HDT1-like n=1 Tax=Alnus glutinosa TaxID=3517 RepID=UPI002D773B12|nr:histone deacetylase HDT1-like [Alnus glutinosa]
MEFWGVEVKAGQPLKVKPGDDKLIHLSQASLGESKNKGNESVPLYLKFGDQKLVLGTLSQEKFPQLSFDLVFEKEFELSHSWKQGSVFFCGYRADSPEEEEDDDEFDTDSEDEEEILPVINSENGKKDATITAKSIAPKPESSEKQVKLVEPSKDDEDDDSSDEDMDNDSDEDDDDSEIGDDTDDDSDEELEATPKKAEQGKKRSSDSAIKTPVPAKKAKQATPQKTDGKKGVHTATPHPSKHAGKNPANSENSKSQTPKSGGQFSCKSCSKTFGSEVGLQSHSKAKHGAN